MCPVERERDRSGCRASGLTPELPAHVVLVRPLLLSSAFVGSAVAGSAVVGSAAASFSGAGSAVASASGAGTTGVARIFVWEGAPGRCHPVDATRPMPPSLAQM